jgi:hypothetical protein
MVTRRLRWAAIGLSETGYRGHIGVNCCRRRSKLGRPRWNLVSSMQQIVHWLKKLDVSEYARLLLRQNDSLTGAGDWHIGFEPFRATSTW